MKRAEHWRIDTFEQWCWRRFLRVPWTARRSNQSILKEISPEYASEGLMLKLKLQCFGHLMRRTDSLEKTLMLGKIEGRRRRERQRMRWFDQEYWSGLPFPSPTNESEVAQSCPTRRTAAYQAPPSTGFSRPRVLEWLAIAFSWERALKALTYLTPIKWEVGGGISTF